MKKGLWIAALAFAAAVAPLCANAIIGPDEGITDTTDMDARLAAIRAAQTHQHDQSEADTLERLKAENAALRAEVARLKLALDAAKPAKEYLSPAERHDKSDL